MYYDKRIRYLSYYESGIKLQNAGYVKFQVRDSLCQMIIYVKGPRLMGSGEARIYLLSERLEEKRENGFGLEDRKNDQEKHLLGTFPIRNGQGYCAVRLNAENMADSGKWYDEICGIRMELYEYQYLEAQWNVMNSMPERLRRQGINIADGQQRQKNKDSGKPENGWDTGNSAAARDRQDVGCDITIRTGNSRQTVSDRQNVRRDIVTENRETEEKAVKVDLIVTPVSENSRVEKVIKEEPAQEAREAETSGVEEITSSDRKAARETDGIIKLTDGMGMEETEREVQVIELTGDVGVKGEEKEAMIAERTEESAKRQIDEEESMQEILERKILREEAETAQPVQSVTSAQAVRSKKSQQTPEEEILQEMEEEEALEAMEGIRPSEQELQPDKWEQLRRTYPVIHPIREEEEYLKISPRDFVIFTEKYQELVHNSFLLHGYYNYKHLILGKKEKGGETIYYLGVPGTFHEREKAVAVMFGFEAFDGKREPAENGDFGYYLRRVEI